MNNENCYNQYKLHDLTGEKIVNSNNHVKRKTSIMEKIKTSIMKKMNKASIVSHFHSKDLAHYQTTNSNLVKVLSMQESSHHFFLAFSSSITGISQIKLSASFSLILPERKLQLSTCRKIRDIIKMHEKRKLLMIANSVWSLSKSSKR